MLATPVLVLWVLSALAFTSQTGVLALCPDGAETCSADGATALLQTASKQKGLGAETEGHRIWPKLIVTRAQIQEVAQKAKPDDLRGLDREQAVTIGSCGLITCMNFLNPKREVQCASCMNDFLQSLGLTEVGVNHVAIGYVLDMLSIPLANSVGVDTYIEAWCPDGLATCTVKRNFPGPLTDSFMDWETVWNMGKQYPAKQWSGEWWRGPELGFFIMDPYIWAGVGTWPPGITLGMTPAQHVVIRPVLENIFSPGEKNSRKYRFTEFLIGKMITEFLDSRRTTGLKMPGDVKAFIFQLFNKLAFDRDVSFEEAEQFVGFQSLVVAMGVLAEILPEPFYRFLSSTSRQYTRYVQEFEPYVENMYGNELRRSCAPSSASCVTQATAAILDGITLAGGVSMPTDISTAVGVLYSTHTTNPYPAREIPAGKELEFFWENIRFFAPVVGFPHWSKRPTCQNSTPEETAKLNKHWGRQEACKEGPKNRITGYADVNEYQGGIRHVPNLAVAQRDPRRWGADSNQFVVRDLKAYKENSVGFAEMAEDTSVANGKMNRSCPGKTLALMIGEAFLKLFKKDEWEVVSPERIKFTMGPTWVSEFVLQASPR